MAPRSPGFVCRDGVAVEELRLVCRGELSCLVCSLDSWSFLVGLTGLASPLPDACGVHGYTQK